MTRRGAGLRWAAPLLLVPLLGYGALTVVPDLRDAVTGLTALAPLALAAAVALEAASLAAFSAMSAVLLRPARTPRFGTLLRIDLAVYGLGGFCPRRRRPVARCVCGC
jgi:hypothetical protein